MIKKKIIYIHQFFSLPSVAGSTRSYDLAKKFIESGHQVEFITTSNGFEENFEKLWNYKEIEGIKFHILGNTTMHNSTPYFKRMWLFSKFLFFSSFKIIKIHGDVVLATSTPLTVGVPAMIKRYRHRTPYIFEARDIWPETVIAIGAIKNKIFQKILYALEAKIYNHAAAIVPLSSDMKSSIVNRFPQLSCPIKVIENISELARFQNNLDSEHSILKEKIGFKPRYTILYAGTFGRVNGIMYVIDLAFKLLQIDPSIAFVLIGKGAEKETVIRAAMSKKVYNVNVFFMDPVPKNQLPQLYYEVDMGSSFVIPIKELWANSANKFFDTLAAGRPMLINHGGWQMQVLTEQNAGYILPAELDQLSNSKLQEFIAYTNDMEQQCRQRKNALDLAQRYSLEEANRKYQTLLENIN